MQTLANVCGTIDDIPLDLKEGIEKLRETKLVYSEEEQLQQLLSGKICMINFSGTVFEFRFSRECYFQVLQRLLHDCASFSTSSPLV